MSKLTDRETGFIQLILRSPDRGEGWRTVSAAVWPLVVKLTYSRPELIEVDPGESGGRVRLTAQGKTISNYLT
jgi:hypothetical protein